MSTAQAQTAPVETGLDRLPPFHTALASILKKPQKFYADFPERPGYKTPLVFLTVAAAFYSAVSFTYFFGGSMQLAVAVLINAIAMPFILASVSWAILTMSSGKVPFERIFAMYAYAFGAVMFFSWVPVVGYACEVWKAGLMACALATGFRLGWKQGLVVVAATFLVVMLFVWSVLPVLQQLQGVAPAGV